MSIEKTIFGNLIGREEYGRRVIPFLQPEYFHDPADRKVFQLIESYVQKYNRFPSKESLEIDLESTPSDSMVYENAKSCISELTHDENTTIEWLVEKTEKFVQEKAVYNAIMDSIQILDDKDKTRDKGSIPKLLSDALSISFDTNVGHDFINNWDSRYEYYHQKVSRIPFDLELMNKITKGGLKPKTLNVVLAGTGVGKSMFMCHCAAANLTQGKNVLYITMEMAEEEIAMRIDANMMDVTMDEIELMTKDAYEKKIQRIKSKTTGKLIIKEYPTSSAGSANFRYLLNELALKKNFKPDVIYIDYLNICNSSRIKYNSNVNSYTYVKAIAEELRGLAVEFGVPVVSATQTTRTGYASSDVDLTDTSESFGLPATVDLMVALISTEELESLGQILVKQLKNRYNDINKSKRFMIGIDRSRMKFYDVEESAQDGLMDDGPVMDKTEFGERAENDGKRSKFKKNFGDFV